MIGLILLIATLVTYRSYLKLSDGANVLVAVPFCVGLYAMAMCVALIVWGV